MAVVIIVEHLALPGRRDDLADVWMRWMADAVSRNAGHVAYRYTFDEDAPDAVVAIQEYASDDDAAAFLRDPAYLAYLAESEPLLARPPVVRRLRPVWSKAGDAGPS